jgi:hypothetical protein
MGDDIHRVIEKSTAASVECDRILAMVYQSSPDEAFAFLNRELDLNWERCPAHFDKRGQVKRSKK